MKRLEPHATETPGPRKRVTLELAERSFPDLIAGVDAAHVRLREIEPDVYRLQAQTRIGEQRKRGIRPSVDVLVELINGFVEETEQHELPPEVDAAWQRLWEAWEEHGRPVTPE